MVSPSSKLPLSPSKTKFAQYQKNLSMIKIFSNPEVKSFLLMTLDKLYLSSKNNKNQSQIMSIISLKGGGETRKEEDEERRRREEEEREGKRRRKKEKKEEKEGEEGKRKDEGKEKEMKEEERKERKRKGKEGGRGRRGEERRGRREGEEKNEEEGGVKKWEQERGTKEDDKREEGVEKWEKAQSYFLTPGKNDLNITKKNDNSGKSFFILRKVNLSYSQHQSSLLAERKREAGKRGRDGGGGRLREEDEGRKEEGKKEEGGRRRHDGRRKDKGGREEEEWGKEGGGEKGGREEEEGEIKRRIKGLRGVAGRKDHNISASYFRELKGKGLNFRNEEDRKELVDFFHADKGFIEGKEENKSTLLPKIRSNNSFQKSEKKTTPFKTIKKEDSSFSFMTIKSERKREAGGVKGGEERERGVMREEGGRREGGGKEDDRFHIESFEVKGEGVYDGEEDFLKYVNRIKVSN